MELLSAQHITAGYGGTEILFDTSVAVSTNEIVTIIGPNGCGKSTLLKAIMGQVPFVKGAMTYCGDDIMGWSARARAAAGIAYVPQLSGVFGSLTVHENLQLGGWSLSHAQLSARIEETLEAFPNLKRFLKRTAGSLSGGERQVVALASALITDPRVLLLDEPSAGLSPLAAEGIFGHITGLRNAERGILIVEQNVRLSLSISDRGYVLAGGKNVVDGTPDAILGNDTIRAAYLGA